MPTRRRVLRHGLAGATLVVAGCGERGGDSPIPGFDPDGETLTVLALGAGNRQELNPYSLTREGETVIEPFQQLVLPAVAPTGESLTSGHSVTVDGEEVSVPCAVSEYSVDDSGVSTTFESGLTYWNGDSLDARAYFLGDKVNWYAFGENADEFPHELQSDTEYRREIDPDTWGDRQGAIHPGPPPFPPSFTGEWVERFEGASTRTANQDVFADLNDTEVDVETYVEEGYGSGAYRVESTDHTSQDGLGARRRDDHPGDVAVPNLVVRTPRSNGSALVTGGDVDVGRGHIGANEADYQREAVPEAIEQVSRYPSPVAGGVQLLFNWSNGHLRRLWVRRALAAALPGGRLVENSYGARGTVVGQHSGLLSSVGREALGRDALDALFDYPIERDTDTASEWMRTAGYTRRDEQWVGPDGEQVVLTLVAGQRVTDLESSVADGLTEFGVTVEVESYRLRPTDLYTTNIRDGNWDLIVGETPVGLTADRFYGAEPSFGPSRTSNTPALFTSPLSVGGAELGVCDRGSEWLSPPETVTLPGEPGLRIDGVSDDDAGTSYRHDAGVDVDVCAAIETVGSLDATESERREAARRCARWYNYALPTFVFGQAREGLWGNTESLSFPETAQGRRLARPPTWSPMQYHVQAGTVR